MGAAMRLGARPRSDRQQLAAHVAALARAMVASSEPGCADRSQARVQMHKQAPKTGVHPS